MNSVVIELQKEALDRNIPISELLRKSLVVAKKLKISDFEIWINFELNGYKNTEDIPEYRFIVGKVKAWNPYHGWQPVLFQDQEKEKMLSRRPCGQSIAEMESLVIGKSDNSSLQMPFQAEIEHQLRKAIEFNLQVTLIVPRTSLIRILDAARTIILNWALRLEEDGILGEGLSFSDHEKKIAEKATYNITNFFGPVQSPMVQQEATHSIQVSLTQQYNIEEIVEYLKVLKDQVDTMSLSIDAHKELVSEIATVEAQVTSSKPKHGILRESLSSIRNILEGAGGSIAAELIKKLIVIMAS